MHTHGHAWAHTHAHTAHTAHMVAAHFTVLVKILHSLTEARHIPIVTVTVASGRGTHHFDQRSRRYVALSKGHLLCLRQKFSNQIQVFEMLPPVFLGQLARDCAVIIVDVVYRLSKTHNK